MVAQASERANEFGRFLTPSLPFRCQCHAMHFVRENYILNSHDNLLFLVESKWCEPVMEMGDPNAPSATIASSVCVRACVWGRHRHTHLWCTTIDGIEWAVWGRNGVPFSAILLFVETFNSLFFNRNVRIHIDGPPPSPHTHTHTRTVGTFVCRCAHVSRESP